MESLIQDLKFGAKLLWKDKGFAVASIATLALCIGANSVIFSVFNSVILRPLPMEAPDRILLIYNSYPKGGVERASNSAGDYYDRLRDVTVFEELAMYNFPGLTIGERGSVDPIKTGNGLPSQVSLPA